MKVAEIYEKVGNLEKMIFFSKRSGFWQLQIKGESKQELHKNVLMLANRVPASVQECAFLTFYGYKSYVKLLTKTQRQHLYKLFVSVRDKLANSNQASVQFLNSLKINETNSLTITEQMRNIINHLTGQLPALILKPFFYKDIFKAIDVQDKRLYRSVEIFKMVLGVVGEEKSEKFLTQQVRNL